MSIQRICQLLMSLVLITIIAFVSERSRILASILTVIPLNITIGLWFIFTGPSGDPGAAADFLRMVLWGLIPTALFVLTCWLGIRQGWPLRQVLLGGYALWVVAMALYRMIDSQVGHT
jgi:hypothetical protein